jgi:hypothetical protein
VADEKLPMKDEYAFGSGYAAYWCLNLHIMKRKNEIHLTTERLKDYDT